MTFDLRSWIRLEHDGIPVWVRPDQPDWFVPNRSGDALLRTLSGRDLSSLNLEERRFLQRLPAGAARSYEGRYGLLRTEHLRELWFHITNRCNLTCTHCLFSSSPHEKSHLDAATILGLAEQASRLGCSVFAITGGEPFIHDEFEQILDGLLAPDDTHVAVLTNGMFLRRSEKRFARWPMDRVHLQISVDGLEAHHDAMRGTGSFAKLERELRWLGERAMPYTISMCVMRENVEEMPGLIDFANSVGASNVHFLWYFTRGRGTEDEFVPPERIFAPFVEASRRAELHGIEIDNLDAHRAQVFAPSGTRHDGGNSGWESLAVGYDGKLYPSPALVGVEQAGTPLTGSLAETWRDSPALEAVRRSSASGEPSPLRFIIGGGDHDHSLVHGGRFQGDDPYVPLYERIALWLIASEAARQHDAGPPALRLKMGEVLERCGERGEVALNHSNCLLALATRDHVGAIKEFYTRAAEVPQETISNPVGYPEEFIAHLPQASRLRSYGCGSPILDATVNAGETVVDLGSGAGAECLIAARLVGSTGRVVGIDMLEPMLDLARKGASAVAERLGYANVEFRQAYLESLPLEDAWVDLVLSNCVINLSRNKRQTFAEIFRVLKPGGRLVISDVVCETEPSIEIRNDETLHGECIAGALAQGDLFGLLEDTGFSSSRVLKRFPYREVQGHPFFSMTFEARKPAVESARRVMYRGPFPAVIAPDGTVLTPGTTREIALDGPLDDSLDIFEFDEHGSVVNAAIGESACCTTPGDGGQVHGCLNVLPRSDVGETRSGGCCGSAGGPDSGDAPGAGCCSAAGSDDTAAAEGTCCAAGSAPQGLVTIEPSAPSPPPKLASDCMLCGAALVYSTEEHEARCVYCGQSFRTTALCEQDHFVCDRCHAVDGIALIEEICTSTQETDLLALLQEIRRHRAIPLHGPEHHALVPGAILATYRNLGGALTVEALRTGIRRGSEVAGGSCGFAGNCGAAVGVGIAFSVILEGTPLTAEPRRSAMRATSEVLNEISRTEAPRCCQRESYVALKKAAELSRDLLPLPLQAAAAMRCGQMSRNKECIGPACPLIQDLIATKHELNT